MTPSKLSDAYNEGTFFVHDNMSTRCKVDIVWCKLVDQINKPIPIKTFRHLEVNVKISWIYVLL